MRSSAENYIARDKSLELDPTKQVKTVRHLEKSLPADESPVFEASDDLNNEEFINANDPENKFVPIEEVADPDSDFVEKEEKEELGQEEGAGEETGEEEMEDDNDVDEVRKSISDYSFKTRGSKFSNLESFHVDHEKGEMLAVGSAEGMLAHENEKDKDDNDSELAEADSREPGRGKTILRYGRKEGHDNLKTLSDSKRERAARGVVREFIHQPLESAKDIKREEESEKIDKGNKSLFRRFLNRLN